MQQLILTKGGGGPHSYVDPAPEKVGGQLTPLDPVAPRPLDRWMDGYTMMASAALALRRAGKHVWLPPRLNRQTNIEKLFTYSLKVTA